MVLRGTMTDVLVEVLFGAFVIMGVVSLLEYLLDR